MEENAVSVPHHREIHSRYQSSNAEPDSLTDTRAGLRKGISMLKEENTRLMQERENLITDLEECKSDLFRRMPPDQISDEYIRKALERIRGSIDEFVFDTMGDVADDVLYNSCQRKQQKWQQKSQKPRNFLDTLIMKQDIRAWEPYECSNFSILSAIIQWILDEYVFKSKYPMGITKEQKATLEEVEKGMWRASGMQKPGRLDLWRSDTLSALTTLPENEPRLERAAEGICIKLNDILSPWLFEAGPFSKVEAKFRDEILKPAIKLHQDLKSASHQYETRYIKFFDRLSPKQMLDEWVLKDADTWHKVRVERDVGTALYCLHPSLIRLRAEGATPIVVAKPEIVVQGPDKSASRRLKDSIPTSSKSGNAAQVRVAEKTSTSPCRPSVPVGPPTHHQQDDRSPGHHHHRKPNVAGGRKKQSLSGRTPRADAPDVPLPSTTPPQSSQTAAAAPQPPPSRKHASGRSTAAQPRSVKSSSAADNSGGFKGLFGR